MIENNDINNNDIKKSFKFTFFYNHDFGTLIYCTLLFYIVNSFVGKLFKFFFIQDLILPIITTLKLVLLFFYTTILFVNFRASKNLLMCLGLLFVVFVVGNVKWDLYLNTITYDTLKGTNISYFVKYLYPFVFLGVFSLIKNKEETISFYFDIIEKFFIVNSIFIVVGFLFSIGVFQSYMHSNRFGYSGLIEPTFLVYTSMIIIARRFFLNKIDLVLVIFCAASLFSGTKNMVLFFMLLIFFYLYEKRKMKLLLFYSTVLISTIVLLKPIVNFFIKIFPFWDSVLSRFGYIGLLTSTRNLNIQHSLEYIKINGTLKNLFFGGLELSKCGVEMDFIDLFLFFGIMGVAIYLLLLSKIINKSYHLIPLIAGFFAGDFLFGTILVCTYFLWLYESQEKKEFF